MLNLKKHLAKRLLFFSFLGAFVLSSVINISFSIYRFQQGRDQIHKELEYIRANYLPPLNIAVWNYDQEMLKTLISSILEHDFISSLKISSEDHSIIETKKEAYNKNDHVQEHDIVYKDKVIGKISISMTEQFLINEFKKSVIVTLVIQLFGLIIFGLLFQFIFNQLVSKHLEKIKTHLEHASQNFFNKNLELERSETWLEGQDELVSVCDAVNKMGSEVKKLTEYKDGIQNDLLQAQIQQSFLQISNGIIHNIANFFFVITLKQDQLFKKMRKNLTSEQMSIFEKDIEVLLASMDSCSDVIKGHQRSANLKMLIKEESTKNVMNDIKILVERDLIKSGIILDLNILDEKIWLAKGQFVLVMLNLIKNSKEAILEATIENGLINIFTNKTDQEYQLFIQDNGPGIPDYKEKNPFSYGMTTKKTGHGFGLSSSKKIVEQMNGSIEFIQEQGKGACFLIKFPLQHHEMNDEDYSIEA